MGFALLRLARHTYASCASSISSWSSKNFSAIRGMQYGQMGRSVRYASAQLTVSAIPEEAHYAQRPAEALCCTEALPLLEARFVRFPFGRPAVPSDGRVLSFSRAAVTPIELSTSAPHRHIGLASWLVYSFLDLNRDS